MFFGQEVPSLQQKNLPQQLSATHPVKEI